MKPTANGSPTELLRQIGSLVPFVILALLIFVPIAELAVIIKVGGVIGVLPTLALLVGMAVLGTALLRQQGLAVLRRSQDALANGQVPVGSALDGLGLLVAAILMMTPGFLTDIVGILLLIPWVRRYLGAWLVSQFIARGSVKVRTARSGPQPPKPGKPAGGPVIEGDYTRVDEP